MAKHFRLSQEEMDALPDAAFYDIAAKAYFLEKQAAEVVKTGVLLAVQAVFEKA